MYLETIVRGISHFGSFVSTKAAMPVALEEDPLLKVLDPEHAQLKVIDATEDSPGGWLEGYASVFGNVDSGGDVVVKGAFAKTIKERLKKGFIKLVDSHQVFNPFGGGTKSIIGVVTEAKEDDYGLWFRAKISSIQDAQDIRTKVKEGILTALSFGYDVIKSSPDPSDAMISQLKELKLYEISVVPWGMNELAHLTVVKAVVPVSPFGAAEKASAFDAEAALARWKKYVSSKDVGEWTDTEWHRYKKAFLWHDPTQAATLDGYKLQVVDIVDSTPQYVFKAAQSAVASVRTLAAWKKDLTAIEVQAKKIYGRFAEAYPEDGVIPGEHIEADESSIETLLTGMKAHAGDPLIQLMEGMKHVVKESGMDTDMDADADAAPIMPPGYKIVAIDAPKRCATCAAFDNCCGAVNGGCDYYNCFVMHNGVCDAFNFPTGDPDA